MKRNLSIGATAILAAVAVAAGWMVASSYIALRLGHIAPDALAQPWLAWWTYAASNPDRWTKAILIMAAIPPTGVIALLAAIGWKVVARVWFQPDHQQKMKATPLYGNSHWARRGDMHTGSIKSSKSLF